MATKELNNPPQLSSYPQIIMEAIDELNQTKGANKSAISNYMESKYGEMPAGHIDLLTNYLNVMKGSGELLFIKNNYLKPGPDVPVKRGRGRPPKAKKPLPTVTVVGPPRPRGRPRKYPNASPEPKKQKTSGESPSLSPGKPTASPRKVMPQPVHNGVEA